ncbi:hypothetical protein RJ639_039512 [Escallonia herrerae]|uniref:Uncharacterized protein n=1 Tax=Escallonia herrerae TaxID=1293975 RepID=A0AA88WL79_9ASTE|nr:hypothetical protein RJ639_039512 [Escallonia herrerae]
MAIFRTAILMLVLLSTMALLAEPRSDTNRVFSPCSDASLQRSDGFSFGIAFSSRTSFFLNNNNSLQLSPCDRRLSLSSSNSQLALFRPKVDEISILTINTTNFSPYEFVGELAMMP